MESLKYGVHPWSHPRDKYGPELERTQDCYHAIEDGTASLFAYLVQDGRLPWEMQTIEVELIRSFQIKTRFDSAWRNENSESVAKIKRAPNQLCK